MYEKGVERCRPLSLTDMKAVVVSDCPGQSVRTFNQMPHETWLGIGNNIGSWECRCLVKYLDCMPLAVTQVAAYIEQAAPRMTVSKYIEMLEKDDRERTALLEKDVRDPRRDRQASNSIIITWHVTFTLYYLSSVEGSRNIINTVYRYITLMVIPEFQII